MNVCLSRMRCKPHVRFLGEGKKATSFSLSDKKINKELDKKEEKLRGLRKKIRRMCR